MSKFVPPTRQVTLTDSKAKQILTSKPIRMNDGAFPVFGRIIGWKRLNNGALGAIVVNPQTNKRRIYGVDFNTGEPRDLGEPQPPRAH